MFSININEYLHDRLIAAGMVPTENEVEILAEIVHGLLIHIDQQYLEMGLNGECDAPCNFECFKEDRCPFDDE